MERNKGMGTSLPGPLSDLRERGYPTAKGNTLFRRSGRAMVSLLEGETKPLAAQGTSPHPSDKAPKASPSGRGGEREQPKGDS